jgi:hypothetical protein
MGDRLAINVTTGDQRARRAARRAAAQGVAPFCGRSRTGVPSGIEIPLFGPETWTVWDASVSALPEGRQVQGGRALASHSPPEPALHDAVDGTGTSMALAKPAQSLAGNVKSYAIFPSRRRDSTRTVRPVAPSDGRQSVPCCSQSFLVMRRRPSSAGPFQTTIVHHQDDRDDHTSISAGRSKLWPHHRPAMDAPQWPPTRTVAFRSFRHVSKPARSPVARGAGYAPRRIAVTPTGRFALGVSKQFQWRAERRGPVP